jgi:hypothetical protein
MCCKIVCVWYYALISADGSNLNVGSSSLLYPEPSIARHMGTRSVITKAGEANWKEDVSLCIYILARHALCFIFRFIELIQAVSG